MKRLMITVLLMAAAGVNWGCEGCQNPSGTCCNCMGQKYPTSSPDECAKLCRENCPEEGAWCES